MAQFQKAELQWLKDLAKTTIQKKLNNEDSKIVEPPYRSLKKEGASFVTLTINGALRGCIGNIAATQALYLDVIENAQNASFRDPRFPPLSKQEFEEVEIEISVMGDFKPHPYKDFDDLCSYLQENKPGVLIRKGVRKALFLPQVWEQLPQSEDFIYHLTQKAGLDINIWDTTDIDVEIFDVIKY